MEFISGSIAGMGATLFTNPLDVLKTRMQLQGELQPRGHHQIYYKNTWQAAYLIVKKEGVLALQKGLIPALLSQGIRHGIKLGFFEWSTNRGYICDSQNKLIISRAIIVSACSGGMAGFLSTPLYKITVQQQSQSALDIAVGHQHKFSSVTKALKNLYSQYGFYGLWKGANANVTRSVIGASAQLTAFTKTKETLKDYDVFFRDNVLFAVFVASTVSVIFQIIFQTPFDVIATRMYNQEVDIDGKGRVYKGVINSFYKIYKHEGIPGFYKGVGINYVKISRHSSLYLIFWEILKAAGKSGIDEHNTCHNPYDDPDGALDTEG